MKAAPTAQSQMLKQPRVVNSGLDRPRRGTPAGVMLLAYVIRTRLDYVGRVGTGNDNAPSGVFGAACNRWPQQICHRAALSR